MQLNKINQKQKPSFSIVNLNPIIRLVKVYFIRTFVELHDKRIAAGTVNGTILVFTLDISNRSWKEDIKLPKVHDDIINSLCVLEGNKLVSASIDATITVFKVEKTAYCK